MELLVVTAVVSVLMALLLPVLASSREVAKAAICQSNIRQLVMANSAYAVDCRGHYVLAAEDIYIGTGGTKRWHGVRNSPGVSPNPQDNLFDPARGRWRGIWTTAGGSSDARAS